MACMPLFQGDSVNVFQYEYLCRLNMGLFVSDVCPHVSVSLIVSILFCSREQDKMLPFKVDRARSSFRKQS